MKSFRSKLNRGKRGGPDAAGSDAATQHSSTLTNMPETSTAAPSLSTTSETTNSVAEETPEAAAERMVKAFCTAQAGDEDSEVVLLPSIVEAAESSPLAAAACARFIRKFMYSEYWSMGNIVYNAIMLLRILTENPGPSFTRNIDKKFVETVRELLRGSPRTNVVHFMAETLQQFENKASIDEGIARLVEMWHKEKLKSHKVLTDRSTRQSSNRTSFWQRQSSQPSQPLQPPQQPPPQTPGPHLPYPQHYPPVQAMPMHSQWPNPTPQMQTGWAPYPSAPTTAPQQQQHHHHHQQERSSHRGNGLPKPRDLRKRLAEATTTAGVLADIVNTTASAHALLRHDLVYELCGRCTRAMAQVLEYMMATEPFPDNEEFAALLATQEALHQSLQHFHRAVLEARKELGVCEARRTADGAAGAEMTSANGKGKATAPMPSREDGPSSNAGGGDNSEAREEDEDDNVPRAGKRHRSERSEDDAMLAAAIAASTAPGASRRSGRAGEGSAGRSYGDEMSGPASGSGENPFADTVQSEWPGSSSAARPGEGSSSGGGQGSSRAAGPVSGHRGSGRGRSNHNYVDSDYESDEEYLRSKRKTGKSSKASTPEQSVAGGSSARALDGSGSGIDSGGGPSSAQPRSSAANGSSPNGSTEEGSSPVARAGPGEGHSGEPMYRY